MNKHIRILGVKVSTRKKTEIQEKIKAFISSEKTNFVTTLNPEIVLEAMKSDEYFRILDKADLSVTDGIGLKFAAFAMGKNIERMTGVDLTGFILRYAEKNHKKTAVINWRDGLSKNEDISAALKKNYPSLEFVIEDADREWSMPYYQAMNITKPEIILVTLGAPWQEKFIYENMSKWPYARLAIGVGGTFDFLTGKTRRAPVAMRYFGFEWLWRVLIQMTRIKERRLWRLKRIINAAVVFPWKFLKWNIRKYFFYRPNIACLLYKKENNKYKILLIERKREEGHWQLPQGGIKKGESLSGAGRRELSEETGTDRFKPVKTLKNQYKYKLTKNPEWVRMRGYKGQKQSLFIAEFTGQDEDIKTNTEEARNWKWTDSDKLIDEVHSLRKIASEIYLNKFNKITVNSKQ